MKSAWAFRIYRWGEVKGITRCLRFFANVKIDNVVAKLSCMALNIIEFATMLSGQTGCEVKGFQSFTERPDEKQKMETILTEYGTVLDTEQFLTGQTKPVGLVIVYLDPEKTDATFYEMNEEVSMNWRRRVS